MSTSWMVSLVDAVTCLAAPAEEQIAELLRLGTSPTADELARAFDEAVGLAIWRGRAHLSMEALDCLEDLDELLAEMADDVDAWTLTALCERSEWQRVRRAAVLTLVELRSAARAIGLADAAREPGAASSGANAASAPSEAPSAPAAARA